MSYRYTGCCYFHVPRVCCAVVQVDVIPTCRELGIAIVAYSPLGRGFLTGAITDVKDLGSDDWRVKGQPRFQGDNFAKVCLLRDLSISLYLSVFPSTGARAERG